MQISPYSPQTVQNRRQNTQAQPNFKANHTISWANPALNHKIGQILDDFPPSFTLHKFSPPELPSIKSFTAHFPKGHEAEEKGFVAGISALRKKLETGTFFGHIISNF